MKSVVQLEDGRIIGISDDFRILEYVNGQWVKPTKTVYGADFYEGTPISVDNLK